MRFARRVRLADSRQVMHSESHDDAGESSGLSTRAVDELSMPDVPATPAYGSCDASIAPRRALSMAPPSRVDSAGFH
jgi:hypothetical protein